MDTIVTGYRLHNTLDIANKDTNFPTNITPTATLFNQPQHQAPALGGKTRAWLTDDSSSKPLSTCHLSSAVGECAHTSATHAKASSVVLLFPGVGGLVRLGSQ